MNWRAWVRQTHRVSGVVFAAVLGVTVVALVLQGPAGVAYLPLLPLAVLLVSGLCLSVLFVVAWRRGPRRSAASWQRRLHRWAAAVFVLTVVAATIALSLPTPVVWISYLPLLPLLLLLVSGLSLFLRSRRVSVVSVEA
ncbi:hypothetical protein [Nocardia callitridis]|uniref:Transmembrane protein n=1 Tax=Nocardia callitridis TaxID=648753 RepID=A0ABP9KPR5_9NOCA